MEEKGGACMGLVGNTEEKIDILEDGKGKRLLF
jgi:hypothetical protein